VITDTGRSVTGDGVPAGAFVGPVTNTPVTATAPGGLVVAGSFALVDGSGRSLMTIGPVSGITLGGRTPATDPLFNATSPTTGGGDTGSVLISQYIKPGTVSGRFYNHYSWLRTMEDLFNVSKVSKGLDRAGHLGYAAQLGLAPFGRDVFTNPSGRRIRLARAADVAGIAQASPTQPQLAIEGDTVSVSTDQGSALATTVGPRVTQPSGLGQPTTVPSTFTVTLSGQSGAIPLGAGEFTINDEQGQLHHPLVETTTGAPMPDWIVPGQPVTLTVKAVLPDGGGRLMWTPAGSTPTVSWDFEVEID
jgi:hypothetical protein